MVKRITGWPQIDWLQWRCPGYSSRGAASTTGRGIVCHRRGPPAGSRCNPWPGRRPWRCKGPERRKMARQRHRRGPAANRAVGANRGASWLAAGRRRVRRRGKRRGSTDRMPGSGRGSRLPAAEVHEGSRWRLDGRVLRWLGYPAASDAAVTGQRNRRTATD